MTKSKNKKPVSIRVSEDDLIEIKRISAENGVPYQNLIQILIHQFVSGKIQIKI